MQPANVLLLLPQNNLMTPRKILIPMFTYSSKGLGLCFAIKKNACIKNSFSRRFFKQLKQKLSDNILKLKIIEKQMTTFEIIEQLTNIVKEPT